VASKLCRRALVQLSYAIGVAEPLSIFVETYGTSQYTSSQLVEIVRRNFDLRPGVLGTPSSLFANRLVKELGLARPIYLPTAAYGHFTDQSYPWEQPKELILN
jgi:S-adenosylmethionine synthetase